MSAMMEDSDNLERFTLRHSSTQASMISFLSLFSRKGLDSLQS